MHICSSVDDTLDDFFAYHPASASWVNLTSRSVISGTPPSSRCNHGFVAAGERVYVHGGYGAGGEEGARSTWVHRGVRT